ncbi:Prolyl tripeptidyl peptidase precursor [Sphingobacterium thalpophilum]|uniref:Prolyl tripeptidyl peptidase n=2 Tax=Sphingobacterium thalpophilum TaxID=259 RepID=A0A4U9VGH1_9SPHI|nr:Prolyl tripeptidyl peptidase precursor [Sphingobacterium thalpophilum]
MLFGFTISCKNKVAFAAISYLITIFELIDKDVFGIMRLQFWTVLFFCVVMLGCRQHHADPIPINHFFSTPEKSSFKISPDGRYIAYIGIDNHCKNIYIIDLQHQDSSKQLTYQNDINVKSFVWNSSSKISFLTEQSSQDSLRLYAVDIKTDKIWPLIKPVRARFRWVHATVSADGSFIAGINDRDSSLFDLYRIYLDGRPRELVLQNPGNMSSWIVSTDGQVRLAIANDSVQQSVLYRTSEKESFKEIVRCDVESSFTPLGYQDSAQSVIYALSNINRDKLALVSYDLSHQRELGELFSHKEVDMSPGGYFSEQNRLLFVNYTTSRQGRHFFDVATKKKYDQLAEQIEGFEFQVLNTDVSGDRIIIKTYTDVNPGGIYFYDFRTKKLTKLADNNPDLKDKELSPNEFVTYKARDGQQITGYLTYPVHSNRKNLPMVVLPHDGPNGREVWGFDNEAQFLANRGYLVFQMNYRGSTGFGKKFWTAGFKEWGGKIQDDITDGVKWLIKEGIADGNRIAIVGKGFGGYSALHAACFNSDLYKCAASYSGYTNLFTYFRDIPPYFKSYVQKMYQIVGNPIREAELFKNISPVFHSDKVRIPVLLAQGGKDRFSSVTDANQFVQKLKNNHIPVQYFLKEDEDRTFKKDENVFGYYNELERFLAKYLVD